MLSKCPLVCIAHGSFATELEEPVFGRLQKGDPYEEVKKLPKYQ